MNLDQANVFAEAVAVTASGIVGDYRNNQKNMATYPAAGGVGTSGARRLYAIVKVDTTFVDGTSVQVSFQSSSATTLATSPTVHAASAVFAVASLTAGATVLAVPLDIQPGTQKKYDGFYATVVGTPSAGKLTCFLSEQAPTYYAFADAVTR